MLIRILILACVSFRLHAQEFSPAPFLGMGKAALAQEGIFTLQDNPSGISNIQQATVASAYQQHFGSVGIATQALYIALPLFNQTSLGATLVNYGIFEVTSLLRGGLSFVRGFGAHFSAAVTVNYHQYVVQQYESDRRYSADLGFQYAFSPALTLGAFWRNIGQASFSTYIDQRIPTEAGLGLRTLLGKEVDIAADIWYESNGQITYKTGIAYHLHPRFVLRGGVSSDPVAFSCGFGIRMEKWHMDMASSFHPVLGSSPQLSLSYAF